MRVASYPSPRSECHALGSRARCRRPGRPSRPSALDLECLFRLGHDRHVVARRAGRAVLAGLLAGLRLQAGALALAAVAEEARTHVELDERPEDDQDAAGVLGPPAGVLADLEDRLEPAGRLLGARVDLGGVVRLV